MPTSSDVADHPVAADHHGSHRNLLWTPDDGAQPRSPIDAIFVPTARRVAYLKEAARLAAELNCPLVTLHSGRWTNAKAAAQRLAGEPEAAGLDLIAIDVPAAG